MWICTICLPEILKKTENETEQNKNEKKPKKNLGKKNQNKKNWWRLLKLFDF